MTYDKSEVIVHLVWGVVVAVAVVILGMIILTAVRDNGDLSRRGYQLDQQNYQACVTFGKWTPVECRAGEYGTR